eukprot:gene6227-6295_t
MSESLTESPALDQATVPKQDLAEGAAQESAAADTVAAAHMDTPKPVKSGAMGSLLAGSALGALIAAVVFVGAPMLMPLLPAQMSEHLQPPVSSAAQTRLAQIEARLAGQDSALKGLSGTDAALKALDLRLKAVEAGPVTSAPASSATAPAPDLEARLAKLEALSTGPKSEARLPVTPEAAPKADNRLAIVVALDILNQRIAQDLAFAAPLTLLENLGAESSKLSLLEPYSEKGLPNIRSLSDAFAAIAPQLLPPEVPSQAGFVEKLWLNAKKLVKIRSRLEPVSTDPAALVQRINSALAQGKWQSALDLAALFPGAAQEKIKPFAAQVSARLAGEQMARTMMDQALTALAQPKN